MRLGVESICQLFELECWLTFSLANNFLKLAACLVVQMPSFFWILIESRTCWLYWLADRRTRDITGLIHAHSRLRFIFFDGWQSFDHWHLYRHHFLRILKEFKALLAFFRVMISNIKSCAYRFFRSLLFISLPYRRLLLRRFNFY